MNIEQIGEVVEMLRTSFATVYIEATALPAVIGRDHNRMPIPQPCKHNGRVIRATDVSVFVKDGYLGTGDSIPVASVDYCQRCEKVLALVKPEDLRRPRVLKPSLVERAAERRAFTPNHPNLTAAVSARRETERRHG